MKSLSSMFAGSFGSAMKRGGFFLAALFVILGAQALAQEATVVGTVTDPSGAAVANASVTITNTDTGVARNLPTGGDGGYVAPDLAIGHYTVHVAAAGFKAAEQKNLVLN